MAVITTNSIAKLLWPGLNKVFGQSYNEHPLVCEQVFEKNKSMKAYEEEVGMTGMGLARVKSEGQSITYDDQRQGFIQRYTNAVVALGFIITREAYEDNLYAQTGLNKAKALGFSLRSAKETIAANVFNRAFNSSYTYGDGVELCSELHPYAGPQGGTWRNELDTAADFSEAALEQALIDIGDFRTERGLRVSIKAKKLLGPSALQFDFQRVLMSELQSGTANNDVNAVRSSNAMPEGYVIWNFLTDADAWFVLTDCPDGMKHFERRPLEFEIDNDFDTENAKFKGTERYTFGNTDPRSVMGSPGA
jgi:hypothetical protein